MREPTTKNRPGFTKAPNALVMSPDVSNAELRLWLLLKAYCLNKTQCFPKIATLASIVGLKDRQTRYILDSLEEKGLLRKEFRRGTTCILEPLDPVKCGSVLPKSKEKLGNGLPQSAESSAVYCRGVRQCIADKEDSTEKEHSTSAQASLGVPAESKKTAVKTKAEKKKPRKQKQPKGCDPRVTLLQNCFQECHKQKFNQAYSPAWSRDGKIFKDLLAIYPLETLERCIGLFFTDTDSYLDGKRTVPMFRTLINSYVQLTAGSSSNGTAHPAAPTPAAHRPLD